MNNRRLLVGAIVIVVALVGWFVFGLLETDDTGPGATDTRVVEATQPELPDPVELPTSEPAAAVPIMTETPDTPPMGDFGDVLSNADPVFVRGFLRAPGDDTDLTDFEMTLYDQNGDDVDWSEVNEQGYFEIYYDGTLAAGWGVGSSASAADSHGETRTILPAWSGQQVTHSAGEPAVEIELQASFAPRLSGLVIDRTTNMPVEGAEVSVGSVLSAWVIEEDFTDTDANGFYSMELPEIPPRDVLVWCRTWEQQSTVVGPLDLLGTDDYKLDIYLVESRPIIGRVVDAAGAPVGDATVTLGSDWLVFEDDHDWEFTEDDGSFEIDPLDVPLEGAWLHVETYDNAPTVYPISPPISGPIEIRVGDAASLRGIVRDAEGNPVDGADIMVVFYRGWLGLENGVYDNDWSDEDGTFEFSLETAPPSESMLVVESEDYRPFSAPLPSVSKYDAASNTWVVEVTLKANN